MTGLKKIVNTFGINNALEVKLISLADDVVTLLVDGIEMKFTISKLDFTEFEMGAVLIIESLPKGQFKVSPKELYLKVAKERKRTSKAAGNSSTPTGSLQRF